MNNHFQNLEKLTLTNADFSQFDLVNSNLCLSKLKTLNLLDFKKMNTQQFQSFIEGCSSIRYVEISTFDGMTSTLNNTLDQFGKSPIAQKLNYLRVVNADVILNTSTTLKDTEDHTITTDEAVDLLKKDWEMAPCHQVLKLRIFSKVDLYDAFQRLDQFVEAKPKPYIPPGNQPHFKWLTLNSQNCSYETLTNLKKFFEAQLSESEQSSYESESILNSRKVSEVKFIGHLKKKTQIRKLLQDCGVKTVTVLSQYKI